MTNSEPAANDCAVLCMEMQRGVVGDLAAISGLSQAVQEAGMIARCSELFAAARAAAVPVIHCTAGFRRDRAGSYQNMPLVNRLLENPDYLIAGTPATEVVPELRAAGDFELLRLHGMSPFTDTGLDSLLRSLNRRTLIVTGVSVNLGIIGLTIEAVNRGYRAIIPSDAVTGYPRHYSELVLEHSLSKIAILCDTQAAIAQFAAG